MAEIYTSGGTALPFLTVAMLQERNRADREALSAIRYTAERLCIETDEAGIPAEPLMRSVYLSLKEICWRLQYRVACTEELLCYEGGLEKPSEAVDICRTLRRFVNLTDMLTDGCMEIGSCGIPGGLYALVHPARLDFVLLLMLEGALRDYPDANVMDFTAGCVQTDLRLELVLRRDPKAETQRFQRPEPPEEDLLPDSPANLTERFCKCYGARLLRQSAEEKCVYTLTLPAAKVRNPLVKVGPDSVQFTDEYLFRAVLSGFLSAETMLTAAADY